METGKRIVFILPGMFVAGGVRYIFKISDQLIRKGCDVKIVYPRSFTGRLARLLSPQLQRTVSHALGVRKTKTPWLSTNATMLEVPVLKPKYIPNSDVVFATAWQTAYAVDSLPDCKGSKFYLIQHYETWSGPIEQVDATWTMPLNKIVVAGWLADLAKNRFHDPEARVVNIGLDPDEFYVGKRTANKRPRVMMMHHHLPWKGFEDGQRAVELARRQVDFQLVLFGPHEPTDPLPEDCEFHVNPSPELLRNLYNSADVFVSPSWLEGGPMPPMEAMACGCAVVATNSGGIVEYAKHGENALLSEPKHPEDLADSLVRILSDADLMARLAENGIRTMRRFTWEHSAEQLLSVLREERTHDIHNAPVTA